MPSASLVIFAGPPAMVTRGDRVGAQVLQKAAGEIAHLDQRVVGQSIKGADGRLGRFARRRADMG